MTGSWLLLTFTFLVMLAAGALSSDWPLELVLPAGAVISLATYLFVRVARPDWH